MDAITPDQLASGAAWYSSQAGVTALTLAVVCICLAVGLVWTVKQWRGAISETDAKWTAALDAVEKRLAAVLDGFRGDIRTNFKVTDDAADKVVEALHSVKIEVARLSGRH